MEFKKLSFSKILLFYSWKFLKNSARERKAKEDKKCRKKRELISRTLIEINNNKLLFISTCDIKLDAIMSEWEAIINQTHESRVRKRQR